MLDNKKLSTLRYDHSTSHPPPARDPLSTSLRQNRPNIHGTSHTLHDVFQRLTSQTSTLHSICLYELNYRLNPNVTNPDPICLWGDRCRCPERAIPLNAPLVFLPIHKGPSNTGHFTLAIRTPTRNLLTPTPSYRILYYDSLNEEAPPPTSTNIYAPFSTPPTTPLSASSLHHSRLNWNAFPESSLWPSC